MLSSDSFVWTSALLSGLFAGVVASLVSLGIEKLGGAIGGILGSAPTTLIPSAIGLWVTLTSSSTSQLTQHSILEFQKSMLVVVPGMFINAGFLYTWKYTPPFMSKRYPSFEPGGTKLLIFVLGVSILFWFIGASTVVLVSRFISSWTLLPQKQDISAWYLIQTDETRPLFYFTVVMLCLHVTAGVIGSWNLPESPKSKGKTSLKMSLIRGSAASLSIFLSVLLGTIDPTVGGIMALFPSIFGTTMVTVWINSGSSVSLGAVGPMVLGSLATSIFAFSFAFTLPGFALVLPTVWAIIVAVLASYVIGISIGSIPSFMFIRWRHTMAPTITNSEEILIENE